MKTKGRTYLKIAGILELLIGVITIGATLWLLSVDPSEYSWLGNINVSGTLISLVWIYVVSGFQIFAGLIAFIFANKANKAKLCKILGLILVIAHFVSLRTGNIDGNMGTQISQYASLLVPCIYVYGAILNGKQ